MRRRFLASLVIGTRSKGVSIISTRRRLVAASFMIPIPDTRGVEIVMSIHEIVVSYEDFVSFLHTFTKLCRPPIGFTLNRFTSVECRSQEIAILVIHLFTVQRRNS